MHPKVGQKWLCIALLHSYITLGLHKDPMFSIHSLAHTESSCLLCCHDYIMPCAGARACAFILSCLRAHQFQHLLYYCAFTLVNPNVFDLGFSQQRNKVYIVCTHTCEISLKWVEFSMLVVKQPPQYSEQHTLVQW